MNVGYRINRRHPLPTSLLHRESTRRVLRPGRASGEPIGCSSIVGKPKPCRIPMDWYRLYPWQYGFAPMVAGSNPQITDRTGAAANPRPATAEFRNWRRLDLIRIPWGLA